MVKVMVSAPNCKISHLFFMWVVCSGCDAVDCRLFREKHNNTAVLREKVKAESTFREKQPDITLHWPISLSANQTEQN